jgi:hypothetical protein
MQATHAGTLITSACCSGDSSSATTLSRTRTRIAPGSTLLTVTTTVAGARVTGLAPLVAAIFLDRERRPHSLEVEVAPARVSDKASTVSRRGAGLGGGGAASPVKARKKWMRLDLVYAIHSAPKALDGVFVEQALQEVDGSRRQAPRVAAAT